MWRVKPKPDPASASPPKSDRRSGADRRQADQGPPKGMRDRRTSLEPRKPEVQELDLTASDWAALDTPTAPQPKKPPAAG